MSARLLSGFLMLGVVVGFGLLSTLRADSPAQASVHQVTIAKR